VSVQSALRELEQIARDTHRELDQLGAPLRGTIEERVNKWWSRNHREFYFAVTQRIADLEGTSGLAIQQRNQCIRALRERGLTLEDIGTIVGLSRERIGQILKKVEAQ
jgi:YesN/AraC family two-component response regulator